MAQDNSSFAADVIIVDLDTTHAAPVYDAAGRLRGMVVIQHDLQAMMARLARLNHALSALHLERLFLGRHKFNHYRVWYQGVLSDYVRQILLDPRTLSRPYVQRRQIETIVQAHLKGSRNYTNEIHVMLTLALLHRVLVDMP